MCCSVGNTNFTRSLRCIACNRIYHSCCICIRYSHYFFFFLFLHKFVGVGNGGKRKNETLNWSSTTYGLIQLQLKSLNFMLLCVHFLGGISFSFCFSSYQDELFETVFLHTLPMCVNVDVTEWMWLHIISKPCLFCSMVVWKLNQCRYSLHNLNSYLHTNSGLNPCSIHIWLHLNCIIWVRNECAGTNDWVSKHVWQMWICWLSLNGTWYTQCNAKHE